MMSRRPRPGGPRHPPPLAPSVSSFKPRAQWSNSGSSIFLYVNLPGFYTDQIKINKDERRRTIQIQGERPLSSQTKARFNEAYRVPETCDMTKLKVSLSHGLLTIEFPAVVEGEKQEKAVQEQGKTVQRPSQEVSRGPGPNGSNLGQKKPLSEEKQAGTSQEKAAPMVNKEEPKTYKSAVEGKRAAPRSSQQKVKEGEGASPSLGAKERAKEEKAVERKEPVQMGQQKIVQKLKEEETTSTIGGRLKPTERAKEEKAIERKKDADVSPNKAVQKEKEKEINRTSVVGGTLEPKVHAKEEKVVERKGNGEIGQKLEEETSGLGQKKDVKYTEPIIRDDKARRTVKEIAATNGAEPGPKTQERVERTVEDVNGDVKSRHDKTVGEKVSEGEIQETEKQKKMEEDGLAKETGDVKDKNGQVGKRKRVNFENHLKEESSGGGEDKEKMVEKSLESEIGPLLVEEGQKSTDIDPPTPTAGISMVEEASQKNDLSLVNVGVAALVIMGFGAYLFLPLLK